MDSRIDWYRLPYSTQEWMSSARSVLLSSSSNVHYSYAPIVLELFFNIKIKNGRAFYLFIHTALGLCPPRTMATAVAGMLACTSFSCLAECGLALLCRACCSVAGCFLPNSKAVGKLFYLLLFCAAAILAIALRYTGESALSGWATLVATACNAATGGSGGVTACFGLQAVYRVSGSLCGFFTIMVLLTLALPVAHHGAWIIKLAAYLLLLGCSVLIPNSFFEGYAQAARFGSILFLVVQCIIIIDFAYVLHEGLLSRMEAREASMTRAGYEPGCLSNGWKVLYLTLAGSLVVGSLVALGFMFPAFATPSCQLGQFFLSETLVVGFVLLLASVLDWGGGTAVGLMPPAVLWAYTTYLAYGALTNNPDAACNPLIATNLSAPASVYVGLAFVILSVSWAAYSSAGGLVLAVSGVAAHERAVASASAARGGAGESRPVAAAVAAATRPTSPAAVGVAKDAASYDDEEGGAGGATVWGSGRSAGGGRGGGATAGKDDDKDEPDRLAWVFHVVMAFAGLYLAMLCTNWGDVSTALASGNPELSLASMWVRIGSQWLIYILYGWTLIAPRVCKSRDFS